jgi:hypothetical protein
MKKILILGNKSYVASGLENKLKNLGFKVDCFTRGINRKVDSQIYGDVLKINDNLLFDDYYDIIINFIYLKSESIEKNIDYLNELVIFCESKKIKKFIHISSIIVFDNLDFIINENSKILQEDIYNQYSNIKVQSEKFLNNYEFKSVILNIVRLGYVIGEGIEIPYIIKLTSKINLIKGDQNSILPLVQKVEIHEALMNLVQINTNEKLFLFVPNSNKTKGELVSQKYPESFNIYLNKNIVLGLIQALSKLNIIKPATLWRFKNIFNSKKFNSTLTEKILNIKFT